MWHPATITTPAASEPVSKTEVKAQASINFTDDDLLLDQLIAGARAHTEKYCGIRLMSQTVTVACDCFADMARFPEAPLRSVTSISYVDVDGATQTLPTSVYEALCDGLEPSIALKFNQSWPAIRPRSRITVAAVVGHETLPDNIKSALLLYIAGRYDIRENQSESGWTAYDSLLCNDRRNP